ncbi:hypothetical protein KDA_32500 [Dictyobacter alpinus]|uniref:Uncharacterized protein n=1 Tax=Dictyobacter alpinus TaxID=2014873 RepID=A0A402B8V8_9CHLR|nr:hypothetical protein [Dictyobacter alpinus]GCE27766.1 hypothetical protein KDA_32500 [Dictyobacter alpinus]
MGQYRQWLFYRNIDQQLTQQIQTFEQELAILQAEIRHLENDTTYSENSILQTLIGVQHIRPDIHQAPERAMPAPKQKAAEQSGGSVSPALFAWSQLPNFDAQEMQKPIVNATTQSPVPHANTSSDDLLPGDLNAFVEAHSQTDPQLKVPWWLRNTRKPAEKNPQSTSPIDQQSIRTNQLVERWFERWGEQTEQTGPTEEGKRHERG